MLYAIAYTDLNLSSLTYFIFLSYSIPINVTLMLGTVFYSLFLFFNNWIIEGGVI